jgi:phosphatidate cytidylyltransferase
MSPTAALDSSIFGFYAAIAAVLLIVGGTTIQILKRASNRNVDHAWKSYRGWLVMIPATFLAIFLGRVTTICFFTAISLFGAKELARATGMYRDWGFVGVAYCSILACGLVSAVSDPNTGVDGWYGMYMALPVYVISAILAVPIIRNQSRGQLQLLALAILTFIYVGWMFGHVAFLANSRNPYGYLLYLLFAVELNDVAAFMFGRFFGRHPLRSNISPKKTWEGSLGALAVSMSLPWLFSFSFPEFTVRDKVLTGLIVGIGGQFGDLAISVIKRDVGVKDMGAVLEGHGGIMDRIDSLIFVGPLFLHVIRYFHDL